MKKVFTLISAFFLLLNSAGYAQPKLTNGNNSVAATTKDGKKFIRKWTTNPFDRHVFVENNGQFDDRIKTGDKVLYGAHLGKIDIYFTNNGIVYRYDKDYFEKKGDVHADPDDPKNEVHETHFLSTEWDGANKAVSVQPKDELKAYYTYGSEKKGSIKANGFRELVYKNLYPVSMPNLNLRKEKTD